MAWNDVLGAIGQKIGDNLKKRDELTGAVTDQMMDRIKMSNPAQQGPPLPDMTDQEKQYGEGMAAGVAGSVAPVAKVAGAVLAPTAEQFAKMAEQPGNWQAAQSLVKQAADAGLNSYHPIARRAQELFNRALIYGRGAK